MTKVRLIAGTINRHPDTEEWRNVHLDIEAREIYDLGLRIPVMPDVIADIAEPLAMFEADYFDEVRCHHVLEHLSLDRAGLAFHNIFRVLKPGGVFDVETPDMGRIAHSWLYGPYGQRELQQWIHGEDLCGAHDPHRSSWNRQMLCEGLWAHGFEILDQPETGLAVRLIAVKPEADG